MRFYCGAYTEKLAHVAGEASAIGIYQLDEKDGTITQTGQSPSIKNSSFLCLDPSGRHLYAISEITDYEGRDDGSLTHYAVDPDTGNLEHRQTVSSKGPGPAYVCLDQSGKFLLLANYVAGNVAVYPVADDGQLGEPTDQKQHEGSSVNRDRQEAPHPHSIVVSPDNQWVYVPDLGLDRIVAYRFDANAGTLTPAPQNDAATPPGTGPRHLAFSPDGRQAFCTLELSSQLAVYDYEQGKLTEQAIVSTLPAGCDQESFTAEVSVAPDGRHVYVSNRGFDSLAIFACDGPALTWIDAKSTEGKTPRHFAISPDGAWVIAGNQDSSSLCCFRRKLETGELSAAAELVHSPTPAMILFT